MKKHGKKNRIIRRGAGKALLRFLIGILLLAAICAVVYIFVLQGDFGIESAPAELFTPPVAATIAPTFTPEPEPESEPTDVPQIEQKELTVSSAGNVVSDGGSFSTNTLPVWNKGTTTQTIVMLAEPTAEPVKTAAAVEAPELSIEQLTDTIKKGLVGKNTAEEGGLKLLVINGFAYLDGKDAALQKAVLLLYNPDDGTARYAYEIEGGSFESEFVYEESSGTNLDKAFFTVSINTAELGDGSYLLGVGITDEEGNFLWDLFDRMIMFDFRVDAGEVIIG